MAETFKIEFGLNLQNISLIAVCEYLWEIPSVKEKIRHHFKYYEEFDNNWCKVTKYVLDCSKLFHPVQLPSTVELSFHDSVVNIGERIYRWVKFLTKCICVDISYADKIFITRIGTIDEKKIFDLVWLRQCSLHDMNENTFINRKIITLACIYAKIDFIKKYSKAILNEIKNFPMYKKIVQNYDDTTYLIITVWLCYFVIGAKDTFNTSPFQNLLFRFQRSGIYLKPTDMFQLCAAVGFKYAAEYYLTMLDKCSLNILLPYVADKCIEQIKEDKSSYKNDNHIDILMTLLNAQSDQGRLLFVFKWRNHYLKLFLNWPYETFFDEVIENYFNYCKNFDVQSYLRSFLKNVVSYIISDFNALLPVKRNSLRNALQKTWSKIAEVDKASICINEVILNQLLEIEDFKSLALLINVKCPPDNIDISYYSISSEIKDWVLTGNFHKLTKFSNETFGHDEDRLIFKQIIFHYIEEVLANDQFYLADRFLDWISSSSNIRTLFKKKIEPKYIVRSLITSKNFSTLEKFLVWRYDTEEQIKTVKNSLKVDHYIRTKIYTIWGEGNSLDDCKKDTFDIIQYFCGSDSEILRYKNEMLMENETSVYDFLSNLVKIQRSENFSVIQDFMTFCELSSEKETEIKNRIVDQIYDCINYFAIKLNSFTIADDLIKWVLKNQANQKTVIGNFMNSQKGLMLCNGMFNINGWGNENDKEYGRFNEWVKTVRNMNSLMTDLIRLNLKLGEKIRAVFENLKQDQLFNTDTQMNLYGVKN